MIQVFFTCFLIVILISCRSKTGEDSTICLPYKISDDKRTDTIEVSDFRMIECKIDADVYFHVLSDPNQHSFVVLNGRNKILDRIECSAKKDDFYNSNKLTISYKKCVVKSGSTAIRVDIYGTHLHQVIMHGADFTSIDTVRSDADVLELIQLGNGCIISSVDVPLLLIPVQYSYSYIINGRADSCYIHNSEGGSNYELPFLNLKNLQYNSLFVEFERDNNLRKNIKLFIGKPKRIYYYFSINNYSVYYQGFPELISKNSYYHLIFPE